MRSFLTAMLLLSSVPALAEDECKIDVGPNDVVKKTGDIVIEAGQYVEDAIALDGTITIKQGAMVKSAIAFHGNVVIEDGAKVSKSALSIGGTVSAAKGSRVKNLIEISEKGLRIRGTDGEDLDLNLVIGGKSIGQRIADEALSKMKNCKIATAKASSKAL
ncbi:MAG: hypothetical protein Q8N23_29500 [Archangium sp.]|nr:hypothetical protein [Archangium sp.]MDP3156842.1 hypothetical protein [Archangium sp.]MDP3569690.1 hypothetical protein [Archangium sp.]